MSDYLHQVTARMLDEPLVTASMILPEKSIAFPVRSGDEENEHPQLQYPLDVHRPVGPTEEYVKVIRVEEDGEKPGQSAPEPTQSYIQPRLKFLDVEEVDLASHKQLRRAEDLPEVRYSAEVSQKEENERKTEQHTIEHIHESEIFKSEKINSLLHRTEALREKEIRHQEVVQQTLLVPPEPLLPRVPSVNRLTIGKITVEIIRPVQPQVKTKERIVTQIVSSPAKDTGTNKLSYGLRQF